MAKCIKAKKAHLFALNRLMAKIPEQKFEESSLKIMNFFRAIKKVLRKQLDELSDLEKDFQKLAEPFAVRNRPLMETINQLNKDKEKNKDAIAEAKAKIDAVEAEFQALPEVIENIKLRKELTEDLNSKEATATFDNEDFNFVDTIFKQNAKVMFKAGEQMDMETMDTIYTMFDSAFVPSEK